jgi:hypothetical protein
VALVVLAATLVAAAAGLPVYVLPATTELSAEPPVDAVVALGGVKLTAEHAYEMAVEAEADVVVVSDPYGIAQRPVIERICSDPRPGPTVICFDPEPPTTRGEAREIRDLAARHGWESVAVVTPTYHVTRSRFVVQRCFPGRVVMVDADVPISAGRWVYHYAYQTVGFVKALGERGC